MSESAEDVREAVRWALTHARSHRDLLGLLMEIVYPMPGHDVRPCLVCGRPVVCEPGYPEGRVACWSCIREGANGDG
jgi:hypothetical protein